MAFICYRFDPVNVSIVLSRMIVAAERHGDANSTRVYARGFFAFGALLVIAAALVRSWAEAYLHRSIVHDKGLHSDRLVADGPYRHLRNPLCLGTDLLAVGIGFLASRVGIIILAGGITLFTYRLIYLEEASLLASQGEGYRRFMQSVPRLFPLLKPCIPAAGGQSNWNDGFTGQIPASPVFRSCGGQFRVCEFKPFPSRRPTAIRTSGVESDDFHWDCASDSKLQLPSGDLILETLLKMIIENDRGDSDNANKAG